MNNAFLVAILIGLLILLIFWISTLIFIFYRKPPNSKLTKKLVVRSLSVFALAFFIFALLSLVDSISI